MNTNAKLFKIGNQIYHVVLFPYIEIDGNRNIHGTIDYNHQEIKLVANMKKEKHEETLIHEIVHGLLYESGTEDLIKEGELEKFVDSLGKYLYRFILENNIIKKEKQHE